MVVFNYPHIVCSFFSFSLFNFKDFHDGGAVIPTDASAKNSTHLKDREKGNVEEGFSNAGREKEHLIATVVETRSGQEEKGFQIAPVGSVPASFPEERKGDDGLMTPPVEEKGSVLLFFFILFMP